MSFFAKISRSKLESLLRLASAPAHHFFPRLELLRKRLLNHTELIGFCEVVPYFLAWYHIVKGDPVTLEDFFLNHAVDQSDFILSHLIIS